MLEFFLKGVLIGVIIALPLGPVGVLCLQRTMAGGVLVGLLSGTAAAVADAFYGAAAAFGLQFVSGFLDSHHFLLQICGGVLLCAMGALMLFRYRPVQKTSGVEYHKMAGAFVTIFVLALTNPMTLATFLAIFAGLGVGQAHTHFGHAAAVVVGVFCGSMLWWIAIAFGGGRLREKVMHRMPQVQKWSGALILLLGLLAFAEAL